MNTKKEIKMEKVSSEISKDELFDLFYRGRVYFKFEAEYMLKVVCFSELCREFRASNLYYSMGF